MLCVRQYESSLPMCLMQRTSVLLSVLIFFIVQSSFTFFVLSRSLGVQWLTYGFDAVQSEFVSSGSLLLYIHRDHKDCWGRGAQDGHLVFHTAPELSNNCQFMGQPFIHVCAPILVLSFAALRLFYLPCEVLISLNLLFFLLLFCLSISNIDKVSSFPLRVSVNVYIYVCIS